MTTAEFPHGTVMLVHGYLRSGFSLSLAGHRLRDGGFRVLNGSHWSLTRTLPELAGELAERVDRAREAGEIVGPLHFLTHSMGGLVVRRLLHDAPPPDLGQIVMLCPPNQGARRAQQIQGLLRLPWRTFDPLAKFDPEGEQLAALVGSVPEGVGVIAGGRGQERGWARLLEGDNDGTVRIEEMALQGASLLQIPTHHSLVMFHPAVLQQAAHFLQHGHFDQEGPGRMLEVPGNPPQPSAG